MSNQPSLNDLDKFNTSLNKLKEEFHKTGRYDDANTKLDEIIKLLVIKFLDSINKTNFLSIEYLKNYSQKHFNTGKNIAKALQDTFTTVSKNRIFYNSDGTNIFGSSPQLNIQETDNEFCEKIISLISNIEIKSGTQNNFDLLNEAFGHFIRDNFRNHKEDAQYMTPQEVVNLMAEIALSDKTYSIKGKKQLTNFAMLDPTCGVGSFLITAHRQISKNHFKNNLTNYIYLGQDKVDRMVRLSKINLLFYKLNPNFIFQGNSIIGNSSLDKYINSVDLILTNPPFGAEFKLDELETDLEKYEILPNIIKYIKTNTINSELLILDKSLKLLKDDGKLLIIVPDSVVSSNGIYETYRQYIINNFILKAVIDLPAVTFAQAGTRTKCSILYIQKSSDKTRRQSSVFMAVADNLGYDVKEKMGATVKVQEGINDLLKISEYYTKHTDAHNIKIISEQPSIVMLPYNQLINGKINANFYKASRIKSLYDINKARPKNTEITTLNQIADSQNAHRRRLPVSDKVKCISVLHINDDSTVKISEVMAYNPTCPGIECFPGEILFSKINPRIPRVAIVPNIGYHLTCSTEFEIITPKDQKFLALIKTLLLSKIAQSQINSLTSGTSSSHNRIKSAELMCIKLPWPNKFSQKENDLLSQASIILKEESNKYKSQKLIQEAFLKIERLITI